jgi:hypothetical protein
MLSRRDGCLTGDRPAPLKIYQICLKPDYKPLALSEAFTRWQKKYGNRC